MTTDLSDALVLTEVVPTATPGVGIGKITINSPRTLNSLNLEILLSMREALGNWEKDPHVALVVIEGAGEKAFCAGGDVKRIASFIDQARAKSESPLALCQVFFENEYRLDYAIHTYPKPIVVWGDGIVMGGGIGVMSGASHRIVTETTMMAMPEITIGLYPDVGASRFLPEMPGRLGLFLGLTAARFYAGDALYLGMADHFIPRSLKEALWDSLKELPLSSASGLHAAMTKSLQSIAAKPPASELKARRVEIDRLVGGNDVHTIYGRIRDMDVSETDVLLKAAKASMLKGSPTSIALTFEQYVRSENISLKNAFRQELILSLQACLHSDFAEGVRALLVDKDNAPKWAPASLDLVSRERVLEHFKAPWAEGDHPLQDL